MDGGMRRGGKGGEGCVMALGLYSYCNGTVATYEEV